MSLPMEPAPDRPELNELIKKSSAAYDALSPIDKVIHDYDQRLNWQVGELLIDNPDWTREQAVELVTQRNGVMHGMRILIEDRVALQKAADEANEQLKQQRQQNTDLQHANTEYRNQWIDNNAKMAAFKRTDEINRDFAEKVRLLVNAVNKLRLSPHISHAPIDLDQKAAFVKAYIESMILPEGCTLSAEVFAENNYVQVRMKPKMHEYHFTVGSDNLIVKEA